MVGSRLMMYSFRAPLWLHAGVVGWHFVTLPQDIAHEIGELAGPPRRGFGSVRVAVTIGGTKWNTSIFPDKKAKSYVLPIKKQVRATEQLSAGDVFEVAIELVES